MAHPAPRSVSRKHVLRALVRSGAEVRHLGGEAVIDFHGRHFRLGGRRGVSRILLLRLIARAREANFPVDVFWAELFGQPKGLVTRS